MAIVLIGTGSFGPSEDGGALTQSINTDESCEEVTIKDKDGNYAGVALISPMTQKVVEIGCTDGDEPPAIGEAFLGCTVTGRTKTSGNAVYSTWSVTVKKWGTLTPTPAS